MSFKSVGVKWIHLLKTMKYISSWKTSLVKMSIKTIFRLCVYKYSQLEMQRLGKKRWYVKKNTIVCVNVCVEVHECMWDGTCLMCEGCAYLWLYSSTLYSNHNALIPNLAYNSLVHPCLHKSLACYLYSQNIPDCT